MNRRLRLALLLAAMAAAGPSVPATQAFDVARTGVSIAWFRVTPAHRHQVESEQADLKTRLYEQEVEAICPPDVVLPDALQRHSLFQRPPPPHS